MAATRFGGTIDPRRRFYGYKPIDRQALLGSAREVSAVALSHFQQQATRDIARPSPAHSPSARSITRRSGSRSILLPGVPGAFALFAPSFVRRRDCSTGKERPYLSRLRLEEDGERGSEAVQEGAGPGHLTVALWESGTCG